MLIVSRIILLVAGCLSLNAAAQTHTLTSWKGSAYRIADEYLQAGFGPHVFDGDFLGHIELEALDISLQPEDRVFPGVYERVQFGILVRSKLEVLEEGCYKISLNSDDGSALWLDEKLTVSNDGHHALRRVTDSVILDAKTYEAKVWYYNAFYGGYAIELDIDRMGMAKSCPEKPFSDPPSDPIVIKSGQLFNRARHTIPTRAIPKLEALVKRLSTMEIRRLTIIGHTDDIGEEADNQRLSDRRAQSVRYFIESRIDLSGVETSTIGKGESEPIGDNSTRKGQSENRRVEVIVE